LGRSRCPKPAPRPWPAQLKLSRARQAEFVICDCAIETRLQGYAAGEDGKAGVRGRLVTKQGQFIARALMVGFLQGAAEVLNKGDTVTLGFSQTNSQDEGNPWGSAALKGTGNALDRIAEFYIDQAYNLFPVIEIDAGRQLDIVLTGHVDLPLPYS